MTEAQAKNYAQWRKRLSPWLERFFDVRVEGAKNFPGTGAALLVCNHRSFIDPYFLGYACKRAINFLAASFSFSLPLVKDFFSSCGALPLPLGGGKQTEKVLKQAVNLLKRGELVAIFPEGVDSMLRRHGGGKVGRFRTGFARLALEAKVPIVPCSVTGLGEYRLVFLPAWVNRLFVKEKKLAQGVHIYFYRKVVVRVGLPVEATPFYGKITKENIDRVSSKIRRIISKLYEGEELNRFVYGSQRFDIVKDYV